MSSVRIRGGIKLKGDVVPIPNKNSLVAVLPAALLTDQEVVYQNLPQTSDVAKILEILRILGARVETSDNKTMICCRGVNSYKIDEKLGGSFRASLMFAGPLLARFGEAMIPLPGGCDLGYRSIAAHLDGFLRMGVKAEFEGEWVRLKAAKKLKKRYQVWQLEASVTASENLLMYAAGIEAEVEITEMACEPHVVDLERLLMSMGAEIKGMGSNKIKIKGRGKLKGGFFEPRPDFVDIAGYMVAAAVTDGEIKIKGANIADIVDGLVRWMELFGVDIKRAGDDLVVSRSKKGLKIDDQKSGFPLAAEGLPKLAPRPWPGFPVDVIPVMATLACKTNGRLLLQNWMYEFGFDFVREMTVLGADIFMADPQKLIIRGPVTFKGGVVTPPAVIQAVKAVFLAALADDTQTVINGVEILQRRYPDIFSMYRNLGARIEVV